MIDCSAAARAETQYIPDLWLQFLWEGLRVELEAAFVAGSLEGGCPKLVVEEDDPRGPARNAEEVIQTSSETGQATRSSQGECKFRQFGLALESEYESDPYVPSDDVEPQPDVPGLRPEK